MTSPTFDEHNQKVSKDAAGPNNVPVINDDYYFENDDDESFHSLPPLLEYEDDLFFESTDEESDDKDSGINSGTHLFESAHSMNFIEKYEEQDVIAMGENDNTSVSSNLHSNDIDNDGVVIQRTDIKQKSEKNEIKVVPKEKSSTLIKDVEHHHNSLQSPWKVISNKIPKEQPQINSISFNHEKNCISIGTSLGFIVRTVHPKRYKSIDQRERLQQISQEVRGGVSLCEMLHSTSLLAIVKTFYPRTLTLLHTKLAPSSSPCKILCEINFGAAIRHVELNRQHFFVLTADAKLHIFDMKTLKRLKSFNILVVDKEPNRWVFHWNATTVGAFWDVSVLFKDNQGQSESKNIGSASSEEKGWIVCKSAEDVGMVNVYDASNLRVVCKAKAHEHSIARIAIGGKGRNQKFATASIKGTIIRVFSLPQCEKLYTLWRGSGKCQIHSLAFDPPAKRVVVSGSLGIIYLYKLEEDPPNKGDTWNNSQTETSLIQKTISSPSQILKHSVNWTSLSTQRLFPATVKDTADSLRPFSKIRVKTDLISSNAIATPNSISKGQSAPNVVAIISSCDAASTNNDIHKSEVNAGIDEDYMLVATMDGKFLKYTMNRRTNVTLLKDADDLILDLDDEDDCMNGVVHPQIY